MIGVVEPPGNGHFLLPFCSPVRSVVHSEALQEAGHGKAPRDESFFNVTTNPCLLDSHLPAARCPLSCAPYGRSVKNVNKSRTPPSFVRIRVNVANAQGEAEWPEFSASRVSRHSEIGYFLLQSQQNTSLSPKDQEMCKCPRGHFLGV